MPDRLNLHFDSLKQSIGGGFPAGLGKAVYSGMQDSPTPVLAAR